MPGLISAMKGPRNVDVPMKLLLKNLAVALLPAAIFLAVMGFSYQSVTAPKTAEHYELQEMGGGFSSFDNDYSGGGLAEPPGAGGLSEPEGSEPLVSLGANELGTEAPARRQRPPKKPGQQSARLRR